MTHHLTLSDKDVMMIDGALRIFRHAAALTQDEWTDTDLLDLEALCENFAKLAETDRIERQISRAKTTDRS